MRRQRIESTGAFIGAVWVFHGLYSKLLNGLPRHREIVARVVGEQFATPVTKVVGAGEVLLAYGLGQAARAQLALPRNRQRWRA
jgi:hypothetical protein